MDKSAAIWRGTVGYWRWPSCAQRVSKALPSKGELSDGSGYRQQIAGRIDTILAKKRQFVGEGAGEDGYRCACRINSDWKPSRKSC